MKVLKIFIVLATISIFSNCSKKDSNEETDSIPNGDFENWIGTSVLENWITNSCPTCVPPYETYIVRQESAAYHGQFAAKFIYNSVYISWAENKFLIFSHPSNLTGYVKCNLLASDSVTIKIKLYDNSTIVDSGQWIGTSSIANYTKINIPITKSSIIVDSALIRIEGGRKNGTTNSNTEFWVDDFSFN